MNGFSRSYMYRSTDGEKKGRKTRNHREDSCKCFPPFVKLHYHDCPAVVKPCPIHGNFIHKQKGDREQNVIISFHPSTKTERLLQPIKTLLAHCNSETKINFQYYSPGGADSREGLKNGQNAYETLKRNLNNNVFMEKTKSFVANNTSKVKKLKQCFHSPCNSIAQKTRSQTSIKEKLNQILREEAKHPQNLFYNMEIPPDDKKYNPTSKWFTSNKGSFSHLLSDEKLDSDFITVTQQDRNNAIHHKIFEIKHRKGVNDVPFVGFPKQSTHLVYSTVNMSGETVNETKGYPTQRKRVNYEKSLGEEPDETGMNLEVCSSEKTNRSVGSSSSGSVYITPFIFVPKGMEDSDVDRRPPPQPQPRQDVDMVEEGVQVDDVYMFERPEGTPKETQTSLQSFQSLPPDPKPAPKPEPVSNSVTPAQFRCRSVLLQTDSFLFEQTICHSSRHMYVHDYEPESATRVEEIYVGSQENAVVTRSYDDEGFRQDKRSDTPRRTPEPGRNTRTTEMQTGTPCREVLITARWETGMRDKTSQTDEQWNLQVSVRTFDSRMNKSQCSARTAVQTPLQLSDKGIQASSHQSRDSEFIRVNSQEVTYVIKPFEQQESDQAIDKLAKTWWGKSHSDSDLYERLKCGCSKVDYGNLYLQSHVSKNSGMNDTPGEKSTVTKVYESAVTSGMENCSKAGNVTLRTKETVERFSDTKQTSTREEELCAAVSDLSELKKIIQEFFEKGSVSSRKTCECERITTTTAKATNRELVERIDRETMTDDFPPPPPPKQEHKKSFTDHTVQTFSEFFSKEVQTLQGRPEKDAFAQTSLEMAEAESQTSIEGEKKDSEAQTSVKLLLNAEEDEKADSPKVKYRTVVIDSESKTKTFFICSVCGREMKNSIDATSTHQVPDRSTKLALVGTEYTESFEVKMRTKKVQNSDTSRVTKASSPMTPERVDDKAPRRRPQESHPVENAQKSKIPVPLSTTYVRFRNNETVVERSTDNPYPERRVPISHASHSIITNRDCICDLQTDPSTSRGVKQTPPQDETKSRPVKTEQQKQEASVGRSSVSNQTNGGKSQKSNKEHIYSVLVTPFLPKELLKTWKSRESDIPSSDDSKSQSTKQKRSYDKDVEAVTAGKKIKMEAKRLSKEFLPELSHLLRQGQIGDCRIWPLSYPAKTSEDERNSLEEQTAKKSLRETSLDIEDDFLPESEHFSDSNNTPGTNENSSFGDEEYEEEEEETTAEELGEQQFDNRHKLRSQSHSVVSFNKSFSPDDATTSKSANTFVFVINSKKHKRSRRKRSK